MSKRNRIKKIIWPLDVFEESKDIQKGVADALQKLTAGRKVEIYPVYVLSPDRFDLPLEFTPPWIDKYRPAAEKTLEQTVKGLTLPGIKEVKVIPYRLNSLRGAVGALLAHSKSIGADMIAIGSHSRTGLSRMLLGSFAETLLAQSKIPVLVVGSEARPAPKIDEIIFPTDFGPKAFKAFLSVLKLAKEMDARIKILHSISNPAEPLLQSGSYLLGGSWVPLPVFLGAHEEKVAKIGARWVRNAAKVKVMAEVVLDRGAPGAVASILKYGKQSKTSVVAIVNQSGPVATALLGSISRQVVRSSPCPVLVLK